MSLLLLGGTAEAKRLARTLQQRGIDVIYSVAGLVRQPQLDCRVISGGFTQFGGLPRFIGDAGVNAILDATHPYASNMSATAVAAARDCGIALWRYQRPAWQPRTGDDWREFDDWRELPALTGAYRAVFLTAGRLSAELAARLAAPGSGKGQRQLLRTATRPDFTLPESMNWIEDIGPFTLDAERALFERYGIDALVSKNSGGDATVAKLEVAREQGLPVFLLRRPRLPMAEREFADLDSCADFVSARCAVAV